MLDNAKLSSILYRIIEIESEQEDTTVFLVITDRYVFDRNGKLITMERPQYKDVCWTVLNDDGEYDIRTSPRGYGRPAPIDATRKDTNLDRVKDEGKILRYIKENNYKIEYYDTIKNKKIKTLEMIFNEDLEIVQLFMRKIDYIDEIVKESITIKFNRGEIISEVRGK